MKNSRVRRWLAAALTGSVFALILVVGAGPVAADGLVTVVPGQDPQSPVQVVTSPGYVQSGAAAVPGSATSINGTPLVYNNGTVVVGVNQGVYYPGYTGFVGYAGYYAPGYSCGGGVCGYTAAGPIVGYDGNGSTLVYDVRGGSVDAYTTDASGRVCEADSFGHCQKNSNVP